MPPRLNLIYFLMGACLLGGSFLFGFAVFKVAGLDDGRLGVFDLPGDGRLLFVFFLHGDSPFAFFLGCAPAQKKYFTVFAFFGKIVSNATK